MVDAQILILNNEEHIFDFNNFALIELGKITESDPLTCRDKLNDVIKDDIILGLTMIIYAGLVGYQKSKFNLKHGYTPQLVANWMAHANLNEFTSVWETFKKVTGMSEVIEAASKETPSEEPTDKKKAPSRGKKSTNTQSVKSV